MTRSLTAAIASLPLSGLGYNRIQALDENMESPPRVESGDRR